MKPPRTLGDGRCVAVHSCETPRCRLCGGGERRRLRRSDGRWGLVAMALDDPGLVVDLLEPVQRHAQLLDGVKAADPQEVLLEGPDEALDTAVAFGLAHEGRRALDAEEGQLALVVVGDELTAVVVAELEAAGDARAEGAEAGTHSLAQRLERLEPGRPAGGVDADAFRRAVIDRDEDRGLPLAGHGRGQVGAPHLVDPLRADRPVVGLRAVRPTDPVRRQQVVLAHQPQDAAFGGADAGEAQPRPDLAMALAVEGTRSEQRADRLDQRLVRHRSDRTRPSPGTRLLASAMSIQRRARYAPEPGHPQGAVGSAGGGRGPAAHGLDLRRAKGRPASRCSILVASSSLAMVRSPTLALRRPISASRPSAARVFNDASPAARKASRQALSSAAGTESSLDNSSRSSPRNSRNTALCLRLADMRRRLSGAGPSPPACWARSAGPAPRAVVSVMLTSSRSSIKHKAVSHRTVERRNINTSPGWPQ